MAYYNIDQKHYAIKRVKMVYSPDSKNPIQDIYNNKVYREIQTASQFSSENIVRYYNSWFEDLSPEDRLEDEKYAQKYSVIRKRLKAKRRNNSSDVSR